MLGHEVELFAGLTAEEGRALKSLNDSLVRASLENYYGIELSQITPRFVRGWFKGRGIELKIAVLAIFSILEIGRKIELESVIFARNVYAGFALCVLLRRNVIYETHAPEEGFRKYLQSKLMRSDRSYVIVISEALRMILKEHHGLSGRKIGLHVYHDAAPFGRPPVLAAGKRELQLRLYSECDLGFSAAEFTVGYFGHLYPGRGLEIIQELAARHTQYKFLVVGGNKEDINERRANNALTNLIFVGFLPHQKALELMSAMEVLLMPYQNSVSIGIPGSDTSQWMSPIKMFEYMASSTPIISSNLPVLREVLEHRHNALLVPPTDCDSWSLALDELASDKGLAISLAANAYSGYRENYNWKSRAQLILDNAQAEWRK